LYEGDDTAFYLRKGFRVVAVEARPDLCAHARELFTHELASGQLILVERAIWTAEGEQIPFYVQSGWSSVFRSSAERDGRSSETVDVLTTTVDHLFHDFGVPRFLKADIEGAEGMVVDAIGRSAAKPTFVSVEDSTGAVAARLHAIGYDRFQMVNQGHLRRARKPSQSREGKDVPVKFDGKCSGFFGRDLPPSHWVEFHSLAGADGLLEPASSERGQSAAGVRVATPRQADPSRMVAGHRLGGHSCDDNWAALAAEVACSVTWRIDETARSPARGFPCCRYRTTCQ
jgi:FkbM family methyltransferase